MKANLKPEFEHQPERGKVGLTIPSVCNGTYTVVCDSVTLSGTLTVPYPAGQTATVGYQLDGSNSTQTITPTWDGNKISFNISSNNNSVPFTASTWNSNLGGQKQWTGDYEAANPRGTPGTWRASSS